MTITGTASFGPILVVGGATARRCVGDILVAAGYEVVMASEPEHCLRVAGASRPRMVAVAVDAEGEGKGGWDRLARPLLGLTPALQVVSVEVDEGRCRAPSFARQLLEEIQYRERPRFTGRRAATP